MQNTGSFWNFGGCKSFSLLSKIYIYIYTNFYIFTTSRNIFTLFTYKHIYIYVHKHQVMNVSIQTRYCIRTQDVQTPISRSLFFVEFLFQYVHKYRYTKRYGTRWEIVSSTPARCCWHLQQAAQAIGRQDAWEGDCDPGFTVTGVVLVVR